MTDREHKLQHAMMSFALWGGMLVHDRDSNRVGDRVASHPSKFVPFKIDRARQ